MIEASEYEGWIWEAEMAMPDLPKLGLLTTDSEILEDNLKPNEQLFDTNRTS
nr:hypothetical protein [Acinetobacter baumannii]